MTAQLRNTLNGWLFIGLSSVFALPAYSQAMRVHMHGADEGYAADGFLYVPTEAKDTRAMLLIPDEAGVTQRISDVAQRFLAAGYLVVVVDLNRGLPPDAATHSAPQVDHDLAAALGFAASRVGSGQDAVGLIGWGSGGAAALRLGSAANSRAIAIEDVAPLQTYAGLSPTHADILGSLPSRASNPSLPQPKELATRLRTLGKTTQVNFYDTTAGGFDDSKISADIQAREAQFFKERLTPRPQP